MSTTDAVQFHPGSAFPLPVPDRWQPPTGAVSGVQVEAAWVTGSGPALAAWLDVASPRGRGGSRVIVFRVLQRGKYLLSRDAGWQDAEQNLACTLVVPIPEDGVAREVYAALPYAVWPVRAGGAMVLEIAVHDPSGELDAITHQPFELPVDLARLPDVLTVSTHAMAAVARAVDGQLDEDEAVEIQALMIEHHGLDELGELSVAQTLGTAVAVAHTPQTLAEALAPMIDAASGAVLVELLYGAARADGAIQPEEQAFIDEILGRLGIHDQVRRGPEGLEDCWDTLEIAPTTSWAEIRAAWRDRVREYHPDRVQGLARGFREFAHLRTVAIQDALARLRAVYGPPPTVDGAGGDDASESPGDSGDSGGR